MAKRWAMWNTSGFLTWFLCCVLQVCSVQQGELDGSFTALLHSGFAPARLNTGTERHAEPSTLTAAQQRPQKPTDKTAGQHCCCYVAANGLSAEDLYFQSEQHMFKCTGLKMNGRTVFLMSGFIIIVSLEKFSLCSEKYWAWRCSFPPQPFKK